MRKAAIVKMENSLHASGKKEMIWFTSPILSVLHLEYGVGYKWATSPMKRKSLSVGLITIGSHIANNPLILSSQLPTWERTPSPLRSRDQSTVRQLSWPWGTVSMMKNTGTIMEAQITRCLEHTDRILRQCSDCGNDYLWKIVCVW